MVKIDGTTITMVRGDTAIIYITIRTPKGTTYKIQQGDEVRFAAKKTYADKDPVILKNIDTETLTLQLDPEDTKSLNMGSTNGKYVYDIQLTQATSGAVDTFIRGQLILLEQVE